MTGVVKLVAWRLLLAEQTYVGLTCVSIIPPSVW